VQSKQNIFYQSSLPRAGSTLLQNIIGQNPKFHVTPTSGMIDMMLGTRIGYNGNHEAKAGDLNQWKEGFYAYCREGFKGYVAALTDKPYILDKNRAWLSYYPLLNEILPNPKILVMVRDLRAVFASMEKKFRANPDMDGGEINNITLQGITTQQRVEQWSMGHPIGYAVNKLNQSFLDKSSNNFFFIRYEDLCTNPEPILNGIYNFFDIEPYKHNFSNIPQITVEDDKVHGIYGDHTIRNTLGMLPNDSKEILGEYTCDWIYNNFKWFFDTFKYNK
jgi:sulfotransferase